MKVTEKFFSRENFETRKTLNRSDFQISKEILEEIETQGVTIERIEELGVPVFKYKTQITLHGIFPPEHKAEFERLFV